MKKYTRTCNLSEQYTRHLLTESARCPICVYATDKISNHFHILLEVPRRPLKEILSTDGELYPSINKLAF